MMASVTPYNNEVDLIFKILAIGDSAVGKTCLVNRFVRNEFTLRTIHTIGVDFAVQTLQIDGRTVKAQIWDTAGQEKYRAITNAYYRGAAGALLVYDVTNRTSFEGLDRWIKDLGEHAAADICVVVVGNKADLAEERVVSMDEARSYCISRGCSYLETSAKENANVHQAFTCLVQEIYQRQQAKRGTSLKDGKAAGGVYADIHVDARGRPLDFAAVQDVIDGNTLVKGMRNEQRSKARCAGC